MDQLSYETKRSDKADPDVALAKALGQWPPAPATRDTTRRKIDPAKIDLKHGAGVATLVEAARALRPGGRLVVVDFAAHEEEFLREAFAHRRLGFSADEIEAFLTEAGLDIAETRAIPPSKGEAGKLTVAIWLAKDPRVLVDAPPEAVREIA